MRRRAASAALVTVLAFLLHAAASPAVPGVFSFDRLLLGAGGPENYIYTAGNVIVPEGGADTGSFYRFVVRDAGGNVRNPSFPCRSAAEFSSADNSYTVQAADPVSTGSAWTYTLQQFSNAACTGTPAKTASKSLYVANATAYADSGLTIVRTSYSPESTAYVVVGGVRPSVNNWSTTWLLPSGGTACANTDSNDRPDSSGTGLLPRTSGAFLQYRPNTSSGGSAWNREPNYETRPCITFATGNEGAWNLRVQWAPTYFVVLSAFSVDATPPPTPTIDSAPPNPSSSSSASFSFSSSEAGVDFRCQLDGAAFTSCTSPQGYSGLADGPHTFQVKSRDTAGNESSAASYSWTVDTVAPPIPTIDSAPPNPSNSSSASFSFSASEAGVGFRCQLDGGGFASCTSPQVYTGLADGAHTYQVKSRDTAGRESAAASYSWTVDTVAPATPTIDSAPPDPSSSSSASFSFSSSETGVGFRCQLDGGGFTSCTSPQGYHGLADGLHTFQVKSRDTAGNESAAASYGWTVNAPPVLTLTIPPNGSATNDPTPTFAGTASTAAGDSATVTVKIYLGGTPTGTPVQTLAATRAPDGSYAVDAAPLAQGTFTGQAEQSDFGGETGYSAPTTFSVDTVAPAVSLTTPADGSTTGDTTPTMSGAAGTAVGDSATVTVKVYPGGTPSGPPLQTLNATRQAASYSVDASPLAPGLYTARAEQADAAGNLGLSSANTFTVEVTSASYRDTVLADDPVSYWRLGETSGTVATDERAANLGSYTGGVALGQPGALAGDANPAASFDGVNDYVVVPHSSTLSATTEVTVEAWIKRVKAGVWQVVVAKPGNGQSRFENYAIWLNTSNQVVAYFGDGVSYVSVVAPAPDTNWHHVVATYDNVTAKLYLDGTLASSTTSTVHLTANTLPLNMGRTNSGLNFFGGLLDEVAVYRTALSAARIRAHYDVGRALDGVPPEVTLQAPAHGVATEDTTPTFSGAASTAAGDSSTVTVRLYQGLDALGTPLQTLTATRQGASYSVEVASAVPPGTYTAQAKQADAGGNSGRSSANTFSVAAPAPSPDRVLIGAGDIASCTESGDTATGALLGTFSNATVATLGDNAYPQGTAAQFANCYEPTGWGPARTRTRPSVGTHDYGDVQGGSLAGYTGYFASQLSLFGASASDASRAYYSYDLGAWHVVVLNAACFYYAPGCSETGQEEWLRADLRSRPAQCTLAYFHNPLFTSGSVHAGDLRMRRYWSVLYEAGAELILNGHQHNYERFAPQNPEGVADAVYGVREIIVGTGGAGHYGFGPPVPNSVVRNGETYGLIKLTLHPTGYDWEFVPEEGGTFTDSGSGACHSPPPS